MTAKGWVESGRSGNQQLTAAKRYKQTPPWVPRQLARLSQAIAPPDTLV